MLSAEGLRHAYGRAVALDGVSFTLAPGQTLAIFGPNGAGKTTLLKVLAGLIRPQQGRARVAGGRRAIGWIGHESHLYGHLSVRENLLFWAALYGVPTAERGVRATAVLDPRVLLLDEPFTGLDLAAAAELRTLLGELRGAGRVLVLATHNVDEGVELATDVAFQRHGRFVQLAPRGARGATEIAAAYRRAVTDA